MAFVDNTTGGRIVRSAGTLHKLTVKASTTVNPGDALGYNSGWVPADADAVIQPVWIAVGRSAGGDEISVTKRAEIDFGSGCTATANDLVYMGSTAGVYSATAVASYGLIVGVMQSAQVGTIDLTTPAVAGALITQTYSTTAGTLAQTAAAVGTTAATNTSPYGYTTAAQADAIRSQLNLLLVDVQTIAGVLNHVINTLKRAGILSN